MRWERSYAGRFWRSLDNLSLISTDQLPRPRPLFRIKLFCTLVVFHSSIRTPVARQDFSRVRSFCWRNVLPTAHPHLGGSRSCGKCRDPWSPERPRSFLRSGFTRLRNVSQPFLLINPGDKYVQCDSILQRFENLLERDMISES